MKTNSLKITDIQHFCMHDGPGLRTVVFLKGCPLSCEWCHNPETRSLKDQIMFSQKKCMGCSLCAQVCRNGAQIVSPERKLIYDKCLLCKECVSQCPTEALTVSGREMNVCDILSEVEKDTAFFGKTGGLSVSGGEPTMQIDGLTALLEAAKSKGINTCLETCGAFSLEKLDKIIPYVDLFLFDIKDTDKERLKKNTGADYDEIIRSLKEIDRLDKNSVMRCIIIPEINMNSEHAQALSDIFRGLKHCGYIELLPYHPYGNSKAEQLGIKQKIYRAPEKAEIYNFAGLLTDNHIPVKCYGSMVTG